MTSARITYEALERQAMALDDNNDAELADMLREVLDVIWYRRLSPSDRDALNRRGVVAPAAQVIFLDMRLPPAEATKVLGSVRAAAPAYLEAVC